MSYVDEKIAKVTLDNKAFTKNAEDTIKSLLQRAMIASTSSCVFKFAFFPSTLIRFALNSFPSLSFNQVYCQRVSLFI